MALKLSAARTVSSTGAKSKPSAKAGKTAPEDEEDEDTEATAGEETEASENDDDGDEGQDDGDGDEGETEDKPKPKKKAKAKTGANSAKTRISAILRSDEAKGRTALAEHLAFDTDLSAEDATGILAVAAKEGAAVTGKSNAFRQAMSERGNPATKPGGASADANADADPVKALIAQNEALMKRVG